MSQKIYPPKSIYLICAISLLLYGCGIFGRTAGGNQNYMYGTASYYGGNGGYGNKKMANGQTFNSNDIHMAAHPTLALGTKLKVTNLANHKVLYVEVTDRMPKYKGRVIDLSKGGAQALGMTNSGTAKVRLNAVSNQEYQAHL